VCTCWGTGVAGNRGAAPLLAVTVATAWLVVRPTPMRVAGADPVQLP
jgi:hypothetical protein